MDFDDALLLLGLDRSTDWVAVRAAYRAAMRSAHPDMASGDAELARRLNDAFGVLEPVFRRNQPMPAPAPTSPRTTAPRPAASASDASPSDTAPPNGSWRGAPSWPDDPLEVALVDDDGLVLVAPADEVFFRLLDALHEEGEVIYADPESNYLEALVHGGAGQLTVSLQGRGGATEAFFTLESMRGGAVPRIDTIVRSLAARLRVRAEER